MTKKINFKLIVITDRKKCKPKTLPEVIRKACVSGVKAIQLREKDLPAADLLLLSKNLRKLTHKHHSKLIINDRLDITLLSDADGIHSPENGILPKQVKSFNKNLIIGKSTHSFKSALKAERDGYDYIIFGPVFRTQSKLKYGKPKGLKVLERVCSMLKIPVFAIGGINPDRAKKCFEAGAQGAAVIGAVMKSENINKTVKEFKESMGSL
jgi:thiamine-phosphate pyrophosphorylase